MYFKVPTKGKMRSETVKDTCNGIGFVTPCYYADIYYGCNNVMNDGSKDIFTHIQQALCPGASNKWKCSHLNEACVYMGGGWNSGSAYCNLNNGGREGKDYSNKNSLCALEV